MCSKGDSIIVDLLKLLCANRFSVSSEVKELLRFYEYTQLCLLLGLRKVEEEEIVFQGGKSILLVMTMLLHTYTHTHTLLHR